jgi:hypothetical protein
VANIDLADAAYSPGKSWLMDYSRKTLCESEAGKDWYSALKQEVDRANKDAGNWKTDEEGRDAKKALLLKPSWRTDWMLPSQRARLAWEDHKGHTSVMSDLSKVAKPSMQKIRAEAAKGKKDLTSCDNSYGAEYQMHAKMAMSYVRNIRRQFSWFNHLGNSVRGHLTQTIFGYTYDRNFVSKGEFYNKPGKVAETFKKALRAQVQQVFQTAPKNFELDGAMGGHEDITAASKAIYATLPKGKGQPSNARWSDLLKITAAMPMVEGPMILFRSGGFDKFQKEKANLGVGSDRVAPAWESFSAFYGKGSYESMLKWDDDEDRLVVVIPEGVKIPAIMIGRHFNAMEENTMAGKTHRGVNLTEVLLPPGTVTTVREDSTVGLLNNHLFEHAAELNGYDADKPHKGAIRVYEAKNMGAKRADYNHGNGIPPTRFMTNKDELKKKYLAKHRFMVNNQIAIGDLELTRSSII